MRIGIIPGVLGMLCTTLSVHAQKPDSVRNVALPEVVIAETYQQLQNKKTALTLEVADRDFLRKHFTGNFMQAMENIPGVQAMDIGSGFSKPMIRGMGFNRVAVLENGIKQEAAVGCRPRSGAGCFQCGCRECNERSCFAALRQ